MTDVPGGAVRGAHGYLNTNPDMQAILVAWGAGIRPATKTGPKQNVDVAATVAKILGVEMKMDGKVLTEFLK